MESIIQLNNLEDLKKIIFLQKTITTQAETELLAAANDTHIDPEEDPMVQAHRFMEAETKVLNKYAKYPTLTEFKYMPNSYDGYKWGATFGVTLIVGELVFEQLKAIHPHFSPVVRQLFILFMSELDNPQHDYLIEPLEKHLRYKIINEKGDGDIPLEQQQAYVRGLVNAIADTIVAIGEGYGMLEPKKGGVVITPLGKRVLLHLIDASSFVEEMTKAHTRFQSTKPKLSMS